MPYIPPVNTAVDFYFDTGPYIPPANTSTDFDLASYGGPTISYSAVPGVIVTLGMPWNPEPGRRESALAAVFQQAEAFNVARQANASQASAALEGRVAAPHRNALIRESRASVSWDDSIQPRENRVASAFDQAAERDLRGQAAPWANASVILEPYIASPFLVLTPYKDRTKTERYFSSAVFAPIWRKFKNEYPEPFRNIERGRLDLEFFRMADYSRLGHIEIGSTWPNNPIQPKDVFRSFSADAATIRNLDSFNTPWGTGRPVDITRAVVYPDYVGPIDDGGEGPGENTFIIPTLRFYIVSNSAQIVRVSDGRDVPVESVQLSINSDGFAWSMTAKLAGRNALALVEGTDAEPVEVDVIVNGTTWRVLVDQWSNSEAWRNTSATIRGRSRSAYLAAPYALPRDYAEASELTAAQLAEQELPSGWALDWGLEDWLVDAGAWKYSRLAPVDAIARIAAAGGGYIQTDRTLDTIHVRPLYPAAPWHWTGQAPDFQLPRAVVVQRESQKRPGQGVDSVYVHGGEVGGILADVVRAGTAGATRAPIIVDPLITDTTPARYRGIAAIAATARQAREVHELPLSASLGGLIEPGALVAFGEDYEGAFQTYWRGLVRGVTVSAGARRSQNGGGALRVRQKIEIERHYLEEV